MPVDVAGDAGVVDRDDRADRVVEQRLEVLRVEPQRRGSMSQKMIRAPWRTNASAVVVNVNDGTIDRVAGLEIQQQCRQLEGGRARGRQQHLLRRRSPA